VIEKLKSRPFLDLIFRADGLLGIPAMSLQSSLGTGASIGLKVNLKYGFELQAKSTTSVFKAGTQIEEKNNSQASTVSSQVHLKETEAWLTSQFFRKLALSKTSSLMLGGGARVGLLSANGSFDSPDGLPGEALTLQSRELGLGVSLMAGLPLGSDFEWVSSGLLDVGMANKSYSLRFNSECAWIGGRLVSPGRTEKPPSYRLGLGGSFSTIMRPFSSDDVLRNVQTQVTLNGIQLGLFAERSL
jgi:hypothetical protein